MNLYISVMVMDDQFTFQSKVVVERETTIQISDSALPYFSETKLMDALMVDALVEYQEKVDALSAPQPSDEVIPDA